MDLVKLEYILGYNHRSEYESEWVKVCDLLQAGRPWNPSVTVRL